MIASRLSVFVFVVLLLCKCSISTAQIDIPAKFPGGNGAYNNYLNANLTYPEKAMEAEADRTVKVIVAIDTLGKASIEAFVYENSGLGFEEEVQRFINAMPRWSPAVYDGVVSKSQVILSFDFKYQHPSPSSDEIEEIETYELDFYVESDIPPFFDYGTDSLKKGIRNILLDSVGLKSIGGSFTVEFIVDTSGRQLNLSILENKSTVSDGDINYAFLVLSGWKPGIKNGKKVNVKTKANVFLD